MKRNHSESGAQEVREGSSSCRALARRESADAKGPVSGQGSSLGEALPLVLAGGSARKARGLLFTRPNEGALLLMPCGDVHTVGMRHRLDIAFVDAAGVVLESYRSVGPFRRLRRKGAVAVVERFSSCASPWFSAGDRVGVVRVEGGRP